MARLDKYRDKRNFRNTPEPSGRIARRPAREGGLFVVHKHAARRLHYDLRLEHDGVLESWAVPKGPGRKPGDKHLAVHVEDHPLDYGEFEGVIPKHEYGGGTVMLWDRGHWRQTRRSNGRIDFELEGHKLRGAWTLTRMKGDDGGKDNWLLIKRSDPDPAPAGLEPEVPDDVSVATGRTMEEIARGDPPARGQERAAGRRKTPAGRRKTPAGRRKTPAGRRKTPAGRRKTPSGRTRSPSKDRASPAGHHADSPTSVSPDGVAGARKGKLPASPRPQLATLVQDLPQGEGWLHEIKFDGYRIMSVVRNGAVKLVSRNGKDWTGRFPAIAQQLERLPARAALLDGEVIALQPDGTSSFRGLQEALSEQRTDDLVYQVFDLIHLDGTDLTGVTLLQRKRVLADLLERAGFVGSARIRFTEHLSGGGSDFFEHACRLGLEGVICKQATARYRSERNRQWLKVKCSRQEELLIGGYTGPAGSRSGFGALLLGAYDDHGRLIYAGKVGTGFNQRQLTALTRELEKREIEKSPFVACPERRGVHWVRPELIAGIEFTEWTRDGSLRHPSFRGLREDKDPEDVRLPELQELQRGANASSSGSSAKSRSAQTQRSARAPSTRSRGTSTASGPAAGTSRVAGVNLTNPDRVLFPDQGITKLELARFYEDIADWILPQLRRRPLALVRCPQGSGAQCFFQKHPGQAMPADMPRTNIREKEGKADYLYVETLKDLVGVVQAGTLELHVWGSRVEDHERPDILVFDLDPGSGVPWQRVLDVAKSLRVRLTEQGLESFPRTTGGKGLHVVVPIEPKLGWDEVKAFTRGIAEAHAQDDPKQLTTNMSKSRRGGRIFLDYLRNGRGATAIASYSTRARAGAPVAVPVRWDELNAAMVSNRYNVGNLRRRLTALKRDPWDGFEQARRPLTKRMLESVGAGGSKRR